MSWKQFTYKTLLFFIPILVIYIGIELLVREIPSSIKNSSQLFHANKAHIETLVLGASQNKRGINPAFLSNPTLTLAGTRQGYRTDYFLLKGLEKELPNLKRIILSSTYRHFESRPNHKEYWKYAGHLLYYDVNAFQRTTYFKDKLLFLSNPDFYSKQLKNNYLHKVTYTYNKWGFQTDTIQSRFKNFNYDKDALKTSYTNKYPAVDEKYIPETSNWLYKVIEICEKNDIEVIIALSPVYDDYYTDTIKEGVISRRDSILKKVLHNYPRVQILNEERNPEFSVYDFLNENHLNPRGAEKFTKKLDSFINENQ